MNVRPLASISSTLSLAAAIAGLAGCSAAPESAADSSSSELSTSATVSSPPAAWNAAWTSSNITQGLPAGVLFRGETPTVVKTARGLEMFQYGTDAVIYHRISTNGGASWGPPDNALGGSWRAAPGAASNGSQLVVTAVKGDGTIWVNSFFSDKWHGWMNTGGNTNNARAAIATDGSYFYLAAVGMEGNLWYNYALLPYLPGGFWGWIDLGGNCDDNVDPTIASWGAGHIDMIVARKGDDEAFHMSVNNYQPGPWEDLGSVNNGSAISSWGSQHLDVFIHTHAGLLEQRTWNGGWNAWSTILGCTTSLVPQAFSTAPGRIDLYDTGSDFSFWHTFYGAGASTAGGQVPYCCGLHGAQCCAPSTGETTACDNLVDACEPVTNSCQTCGVAAGQACCVGGGHPDPMCTGAVVCNLNTDRCEPWSECGTNGHACCSVGGACHDGSTCFGANAFGTTGMCKKAAPACGGAGAACSASAGCCAPNACSAGTCKAPGATTCSGKAATASAQYVSIEVRNPDGCAVAEPAPFANTSAEALACAQLSYPGDQLTIGSAALNTYSFTYEVGDPEDGVVACFEITNVLAFDGNDAQSCADAASPTGEATPGMCE